MFFRKKPQFDELLKQIKAEFPYFNRLIGGWATRIQNKSELQEVIKRWTKTIEIAQSLIKQRPDSVEAKYLLADLLRIGHNINVAGAAQASQNILKEIIHSNPNHFQAHMSLASLYISVNPPLASHAEQLFLRAKDLIVPKVHPDIFQGLGFACLYQNKITDAISYFESYLQLHPEPEIQQLLDGLKSGKQLTLVTQDLSGKRTLTPHGNHT